MCTVTFIARRNGYTLGMNRDEKLTRVAGLPPRLTHIKERAILSPCEPNGGTWIGVNDTGMTLALINWYSITNRVTGNVLSRGEVVKSSLVASSSAALDKTLKQLPLTRVNPFRLIGILPADRVVIEWRWNLSHLKRRAHRWQTNTWISSGFDEPGAQKIRGKVFREALRQQSADSLDRLRRLHRSHGSEPSPYSHCMHRADAATVSYTEIAISHRFATMRHTPGAPCCTAAMLARGLQLNL